MKCKICFVTLVWFIIASCEKNEPVGFQTLSGIWNVDSVDIDSYENNVPSGGVRVIESPHKLDFQYKNHVIQKRSGQIDTAVFHQNQPGYAISDLDFNGVNDTTYIYFIGQGNSANLEWTIFKDSIGTVEYKSLGIMYLSK